MKRRKFISLALISALEFLFTGKLQADEKKLNISETKPDPSAWKDDEINICWIGHATVLINFYGSIILTDPVLFDNIGLYFFGLTFGQTRYTKPALNIDEIPRPDIVLISHAHMDHMDYKTLLNLTDRFPGQLDCITAYNTADVIAELKWKTLTEMDWEDSVQIHGTNISAHKVKHFGWRYPWEKDRSRGYIKTGRSYNSYLIEKNGRKIYFGGDTAYIYRNQPEKLKNTDIVIMPIGAYRPWKKNHCNPEEALIMAKHQMNAEYFIPVHFYTFRLGTEPRDEPLKWLLDSAPRFNLKISVTLPGGVLTVR